MSPVGLVLSGGEVLLGSAGVDFARRALVVALDLHRVHHRAVPVELAELAELLEVAASRYSGGAEAEVPPSACPAPSDELVNPIGAKEVAAVLGCTVRNATALCLRGAFPSARMTPDGWRLERAELEARCA